MIPGTLDITVVENADTIIPITLPITTASTTGYSAVADIRKTDNPTSTLLLHLAPALDINGGKLRATVTITKAQSVTLVPAIFANEGTSWSLQVAGPSSTLQWVKGAVRVERTPTV